MGVFNFVVNTIILVEIEIAGNALQTHDKALNSLFTSIYNGNKESSLSSIERHVLSQSPAVSYREIRSSSDSEESDGSVGGPDIVAYLVTSQKEHFLRTDPAALPPVAGRQNASEITIKPNASIVDDEYKLDSSESLILDMPTNTTTITLRKKPKKKKKKKKKVKKTKKKTAGESEEMKESLRSCTSKSIKKCKKAGKAALKSACDKYACKGKFRSVFKKENKKICKQMFNEPKKTKETYLSDEDW